MTTGLVPTLPAISSDVTRSSGMEASRVRMWTAMENREFIQRGTALSSRSEVPKTYRNIICFGWAYRTSTCCRFSPRKEYNVMPTPDSILVTGATGNIGSSIAKHLERLGKQFRLLARNPNNLSAFPTADKVKGDYGN